MTRKLCPIAGATIALAGRFARFWLLIFLLLPGLSAEPAAAAERQVLHGYAMPPGTNSTPIQRVPGWTRLDLTIGLPLRNHEGLTNLLARIYDRSSPDFRHYLTVEQFTEQFGPTDEDYQAAIKFERAHGLKIRTKH